MSQYTKAKQLKDLVEFSSGNRCFNALTILKEQFQQSLTELEEMDWEKYVDTFGADTTDVDAIITQVKINIEKDCGMDFDDIPAICHHCGTVLTEDYEYQMDACKWCLAEIADSGC